MSHPLDTARRPERLQLVVLQAPPDDPPLALCEQQQRRVKGLLLALG
jgi:hypothetical protein